MTGGHGTGAAFGKLMEEQYQFPGAVTLAMAAATFGLVSGGLIGGPVGTALISRDPAEDAGPRPGATAGGRRRSRRWASTARSTPRWRARRRRAYRC